MDALFLGGGNEVGRVGLVLEQDGARVLFDYGFIPRDPPLYPMPAPPVDLLLVTHSHLDHCGLAPWLTARYETRMVGTAVTRDVATLLQYDSVKIAKLEGYSEMYDEDDVKRCNHSFDAVPFGELFDVGGFEVRTHSAGHIPGATMFELNARETTLVTGDLNTYSSGLTWGAHPVKCDNLIIESTYAGRTHPNREQTVRKFLASIKEVLDEGGQVICPAFAVGRTQELLLMLSGTGIDYWVDGMGKTVTRIYLDHPEFLRSGKKLRFAKDHGEEVRSPRNRQQAAHAEVIVTTSGMLDGGPALHYIERIRDDPKSAIFLSGYQVEGTNGRLLLEQGMLDVHGVRERVQAQVQFFDFSAHAGHEELVSFIEACDPKRVVLMHGEHREELARAFEGQREVLLPTNGQPFVLGGKA